MVQVHVGPLLRLSLSANVLVAPLCQVGKVLVTDSIGKMPPDSRK